MSQGFYSDALVNWFHRDLRSIKIPDKPITITGELTWEYLNEKLFNKFVLGNDTNMQLWLTVLCTKTDPKSDRWDKIGPIEVTQAATQQQARDIAIAQATTHDPEFAIKLIEGRAEVAVRTF